MKYFSLTFMFAMLFISNNLHSQKSLKEIELDTQRTIRKLIPKINKFVEKDSLVMIDINGLSVSATSLFEKINSDENFNQQTDTLFIQSLEQSQKMLEELRSDFQSYEFATKTIEDIKKDYDIKLESSPLGINSRIKSTIRVSVLTKRNDLAVPGYDVRCNYMWDSDLKVGKHVFNNQTNNAVRNLSPGYYIFWIEKDGIVIQKKERVEIGNMMESSETIIFNL